MNPRSSRSARRPAWPAWLLVGALLLAQSPGWLHRLAHGAPVPGAQATAWSADHEAGGATCRLVDQLAHADALCAPALDVASVTARQQAPGFVPAPTVVGRAPHRYRARGPPAAAPLLG